MRYLLIITVLIFGANLFAGGGWPQKKGEGYFKAAQGMIRASHYYAKDGGVVDIATTSYYATYLYGEYGITKRLTGVGYFPILARVTKNSVVNKETGEELIPGDELTSVGDWTVGLKYGIIPSGKWVWSAGLDLKLPFGNSEGGETMLLQTGDGAFSQLLKTEVSTTLGSLYFSGLLGIRHRGKDYSDDWHSGVEVGWNVKKKDKFYAILKVRSVQSFFNSEETLQLQNSLFANNLEFISIGPEFHYFFDNNWGVNLTAYGAVQGRNILADPYLEVGVSYNLKKG